MAEYTLAHIGINAADEKEALAVAETFEKIFGFPVRNGHSSVFAGTAAEVMKSPYLGKNGHIAVGTPDVKAAVAEIEAKGFAFDPDTAKYNDDGTLKAIYLKDEIGGFAVHLVKKP